MKRTLGVIGLMVAGVLGNAQAATTKMYFIHSDHLGTPQVLTDQEQTVVWRAEYQPFGEAVVDEDPDGDGVKVTMPLRFPGQYADPETGLNYNYHRDYDPSLGRYVQSDPIGLQGGINTYAYVVNNPLSFIDTNGLNPIAIIAWGTRATSTAGKFGAFGAPKINSTSYIPGVTISPRGEVILPPWVTPSDFSDNGFLCEEPASEKEAKRIARGIERELGKEARREFHDMKNSGEPDRPRTQLIQDAQDVYLNRGKPIPPWLL